MDLNIRDSVFYTRSTGLRVPAKVTGYWDKGYVEFEYVQGAVRIINHHCPIDPLSFGIPSWDSPPPTPSSPPAADIPGDAAGGSPLCGRSPTPSPSSPPAANILDDTCGDTPLHGRSPLRTSSRSPLHGVVIVRKCKGSFCSSSYGWCSELLHVETARCYKPLQQRTKTAHMCSGIGQIWERRTEAFVSRSVEVLWS